MEKITNKELTDRGICPTCYDREHNHIVYGDNKNQMLYEDKEIECFLCIYHKCFDCLYIDSCPYIVTPTLFPTKKGICKR